MSQIDAPNAPPQPPVGSPGVITPELEARVRALGREMPGAPAVFDADGTLWREDVGEAFLCHLIESGLVRLPDGGDPYQAYERAVARDKAAGYAFAAQLLAGLEVARVAVEAVKFARDWVPPRLVSDTQALRALCEAAGLRPAVVSASALPIVLAAAPMAGFSRDRCRGIELAVREGRFTTEVVPPVTYAEGKIAATERFGRIALACGDSLAGDLAMLLEAKLAVVVAPPAGSPLSAEAHRHGWHVLAQDG